MARFVIAPTGEVAAARTESSSLDDGAVERCLQTRLLGMRFPEPARHQDVIVTWPMEFQPNS